MSVEFEMQLLMEREVVAARGNECVCVSVSECVLLPEIFVLKPVCNYRAGFLIDSGLLHLWAS